MGEKETLIHKVVRLRTENLVGQANGWIKRLNRKDDWDIYLLPDDPSLNQIERLDEDLQNLSEKVSDRDEKMRLINARQQVQELIRMYRTYQSVTVPKNTKTNNEHAKEA